MLFGQGDMLFQNFFWHYHGTNPWREDRPIFLQDGYTRASGTNYQVELLALDLRTQEFKLVTSTPLLDGTELDCSLEATVDK